MKIIRHGTPQPPVISDMIAECEKCKCVFTFWKNESRQMSNNGGGSVFYINCPECGFSGCAYDTGYPRNSEKDRESDRHVKEMQAALRSLITP